MLIWNPNFLEKDGQKAFAILPYDEFVKVEETLQDYEDLKLLRLAKIKEDSASTVSLEEAKKLLGI